MTSPALIRRSLHFPNASLGPWTADIDLGVVGGRIECVGLAVRPFDDQTDIALTTGVLRALPLGSLISRVRVDADDEVLALVGLKFPQMLGVLRDVGLGPLAVEHKGPGRKPKPRSHFEEVAKIYLLAQDSPTKAVSEHFHVSRSTAANWVRTARGYGFIALTTRGRKSGVPPELSG
jgi:hypothetical protein